MANQNTSDDVLQELAFALEKKGAAPPPPTLPSDTDEDAPKHGATSDVVEGRYTVKIDTPLPEYDSDFAKAYAVGEGKQAISPAYYALVYKKSVSVRPEVINTLRKKLHNYLLSPLASEIITISATNQKYFVVVLEKPQGKTLQQLMDEGQVFPEEVIARYIVPPLAKLLEQLEESYICHGRINASNIYLDYKSYYLTVGECVSEPCGYSQIPVYEPTERAMCIAAGKGEDNVSIDYYALGVLVLHLMVGKPLAKHLSTEETIFSKLSLGSFNTLTEGITIPPTISDLFIGLLSDKRIERWGAEKVKTWLNGRQYNIRFPPAPVDSTRAIHFNGVGYFNCRSLAYHLSQNWREAKKFLREERLAKWIESSLSSPTLASQIRHINKITTVENKRQLFDNHDELVTRTIMLLDPEGPLRVGGFCINLKALGTVLAHAYAVENRDQIQIIGNLLNASIITFWAAVSNMENSDQHNNSWVLDKVSTYVNKGGLGFGMERCLYELNPLIPCQSPSAIKNYPLSLKEILHELDDIANSLKEGTELIDRHIAAFIASRISLPSEVRIKGLVKFPEFATNKHVLVLGLLVLAQKKSYIKKLKGIATYITNNLLTLIDRLNSISLRKELREDIERLSKDGNLSLLLKLISNPEFLAKDKVGFKEAARKYRILYERKKSLKNASALNNTGYRYGLQLSVIIAYLLCAVEILYLVATNM